MHNVSKTCVQTVRSGGVKYVHGLGIFTAVCTTKYLYATCTKVYTSTVHILRRQFASAIGQVIHTIHTPYISPNILNRLLIINKHSGELL